MSLDDIYRYMRDIKTVKARIRRAEKQLETEQSSYKRQALECLIHQLEMMVEDFKNRISCYSTLDA